MFQPWGWSICFNGIDCTNSSLWQIKAGLSTAHLLTPLSGVSLFLVKLVQMVRWAFFTIDTLLLRSGISLHFGIDEMRLGPVIFYVWFWLLTKRCSLWLLLWFYCIAIHSISIYIFALSILWSSIINNKFNNQKRWTRPSILQSPALSILRKLQDAFETNTHGPQNCWVSCLVAGSVCFSSTRSQW